MPLKRPPSPVQQKSPEQPTGQITNQASWKASNSPQAFLISAVTGVIGGLICAALRFGLRFLQWLITNHSGLLADAASQLPLWRRAMTPVFGALLATVIVKGSQKLLRDRKYTEYVEAVRFEAGHIPFLSTLWTTVASGLSIASGAAIGREGSMIQFAASAISALGQRWRLSPLPLPRLVALGSAAAVAAVYQAPIAGGFFALEIVLGTKVFSWAALNQIPTLLLSAGAGAAMSHWLLGSGPLFAVTTAIHFSWHDSFPLALTGAALGLLGPLYYRIIKGAGFLRSWPMPMLCSGAVVGLLSCLQPDVWGNGDSAVLGIVAGKLTLQIAGIILLLRLCATAACVGSGVVGGVFTPTVFAGSALGLLCGQSFYLLLPHTSPAIGYAVLGIGCLLASVTHAPFMAAFMTVELTGTPEWLPIILLCSLLSWQIAARISPDSLYAVATPRPAMSIRSHALGN